MDKLLLFLELMLKIFGFRSLDMIGDETMQDLSNYYRSAVSETRYSACIRCRLVRRGLARICHDFLIPGTIVDLDS